MNPCTKCGACCRFAYAISGMPTKEDGSCAFLLEQDGGGTCTVYETRPEICRVKDWEEAAPLCNALQRAQGLSETFKVKLVRIEH